MAIAEFDSILTRGSATPLSEHPYVVEGAKLTDWDVAGVLRAETVASDGWNVFAMLLMLGVLVALLAKNREFLLYRFRDFLTNERRFSNAAMMTDASELPQTLVLLVITCCSFSFIFHDFLAKIPSVAQWLGESFHLYAVIFALMLLFILSKAFLYKVVNWVFFPSAKNQKWMSSYFFLTSMTSFVVFLVAALYMFVNISYLEVAICLLVLLFLYELLLFYKLNVNFQAKKYGQLLIFLYFCAVEIVPLLAIWHFFAQNHTI